jgi:hypothetical protein
MRQNRGPVIQQVSQSMRMGSAVDVYALVEKLKTEFPHSTEVELERIISEEVAKARCNAIWQKRAR